MAEYGSLRFVDKVGNNLLFRGGAPIENGVRQGPAEQAQERLHAVAAAAAILSRHHLPVASEQGRQLRYRAELEYFHDNPFAGEVHLWDTLGTDRCYFTTAPDERDRLVKSLDQWLGDPLIWRVATLRQWLELSQTPYKPQAVIDLPCVFYVHCSGGCDRTGEMIGGLPAALQRPVLGGHVGRAAVPASDGLRQLSRAAMVRVLAQ